MVRKGGKEKEKKLINLRPNKVSYNNAKLIAVVQAPIKGRELTSFTFIFGSAYELSISVLGEKEKKRKKYIYIFV